MVSSSLRCFAAAIAAGFFSSKAHGANLSFSTDIANTGGGVNDYSSWRGVGTNGDVVAITSPNADVNGGTNNGHVSLYGRNVGGDNNWGLIRTLTDNGTPNTGSLFTGVLSMTQDYLIVGDVGFDTPATNAGRILLYQKDVGGIDNWGFVKAIQPTSDTMDAGAAFGASASDIHGTTLVGCSPNFASSFGKCWVFEKDQGGVDNWGEVKSITATPHENQNFASSDGVLFGDTLVIAAQRADADSAPATDDTGAAYIFGRNEGGVDNWGLQFVLGADHINAQSPNTLAAGDLAFSKFDLSSDGERLATCVLFDDTTASNAGLVIVFTRSDGAWLIEKKIQDDTPLGNERFCNGGVALSDDGKTLFVANGNDDTVGNNNGALKVYGLNEGGPNNWGIRESIFGDQADSKFGEDIAFSSGTLVVGQPEWDEGGGNANVGRALIYALAECTLSSECGEGLYCSSGQRCTQTPCVAHADCSNLFPAGRLPYCNGKTGFCEDEYPGTCGSDADCSIKVNRIVADTHSVGKVFQSASIVGNVTETRAAVDSIINRTVVDTAITSGIILPFVTGTERAVFAADLFTQVNNDTLVLEKIRSIACGPVVEEVCSVEIPPVLLVDSSFQNEITVVISYVIDRDAFAALQATDSFSDPDFAQALADAVGADVANVVVTAVDGTLAIEYAVAEESDGLEPLDEAVVQAIDALAGEVEGITSTVAAELGLSSAQFSAASVDRCADRDCNGRGACDEASGVCECSDPSYWGVNCETLVDCGDGTKDAGRAYCICEYPKHGARCESTKDCSACP